MKYAVKKFEGLAAQFESRGYQLYLVGGAVRDTILGVRPQDYDLATDALPEETAAILRGLGAPFVIVGKVLGTIETRINRERVEITTFRTCTRRRKGGAGTSASFGARIIEDLSRRDFTLNSLAVSLTTAQDITTGEVIDPFHGMDDLRARHLRMTFKNTFEEDPLRILRGAQFAARFGMVVDGRTQEAMQSNAQGLRDLSSERIAGEIRKALASDKPSVAFRLLRDIGALAIILPELQDLVGIEQPKKWHSYDAFDHTMEVVDAAAKMDLSLDLRLAALFHDLGKATTRKIEDDGEIHFYQHQFVSEKQIKNIGRRLKLSSAKFDVDLVSKLARHHMDAISDFKTDKAIRRFISRIGPEHALELIDLRVADKKGGAFPDRMDGILQFRRKVVELMARKEPFDVKDLAIGGNDLIAMGLQPGPAFKDILAHLLEAVLDDPALNTKEKLQALITAKENNE